MIFDFCYGEMVEFYLGICCFIVLNLGFFMFYGMNMYFLGQKNIVIVDLGLVSEDYFVVLMRVMEGQIVEVILVMYIYMDYFLVVVKLRFMIGVLVLGCVCYMFVWDLMVGEVNLLDVSNDKVYVFDQVLVDGEIVNLVGFVLESVVILGYMVNYFVFLLVDELILISGDYVMVWLILIVVFLDGSMCDYMCLFDWLLVCDEMVYLFGYGIVLCNVLEYVEYFK